MHNTRPVESRAYLSLRTPRFNELPYAECRHDPAVHLARLDELQHHPLQLRRLGPALHHRDQKIAAMSERDADGGMADALAHREIIGPHSSRQLRDTDRLANLERYKTLADQIEIGDAIDLVVIGHSGAAIAEADLRPHVDFDVAARRATKRAARGPAVAGKRPRNFLPTHFTSALRLELRALV